MAGGLIGESKMLPNKETITTLTVYTGAAIDQVTNHGIAAAITSSQISGFVICGITVGGWVTILIALGTLLLFIMNVAKFVKFCYNSYQKLKSLREKSQDVDISTSEGHDSETTRNR